MAIRVIRLGTSREPEEGLRLGTVRRPPRGVRKEDLSRKDFYDVWMPDLAPSAPLVSWVQSEPITPERWARFARRYRSEMRKPGAARLIELLAALSAETDFSVGCYCADEGQCHAVAAARASRPRRSHGRVGQQRREEGREGRPRRFNSLRAQRLPRNARRRKELAVLRDIAHPFVLPGFLSMSGRKVVSSPIAGRYEQTR